MEITITLSSPMWKMLIYWDTLDLAAKRLLHHDCKYSELNLSLHAVFSAKEISSAGFIILVFSWKCNIYLGADAGLPMMSLISKGPIISSSCRTLKNAPVSHQTPLSWSDRSQFHHLASCMLRMVQEGILTVGGILRWEVLLIMQIQEKR